MRNILTKFALAATLAFAMTFTLSCSSGGGGGGGDEPSSSSAKKTSSSSIAPGSSARLSSSSATASSSSSGAVGSSSSVQGNSSSAVGSSSSVNSSSSARGSSSSAVGSSSSANSSSSAQGSSSSAVGSSSSLGQSSSSSANVSSSSAISSSSAQSSSSAPKTCNGTEYNTLTQDCCGNSAIFSKATEFCSGNAVYDKCSNSDYNPTNQRCEGGILETKCGSEWYNASNANLRCQSSVIETKCGSGWYDASNTDLRCQSNAVETKCGSGWYNASTQFCHTDNAVYGKCGGAVAYNPETERCCGSSKYAPSTRFCDARDGKAYKFVAIGSQTWMAENLNYNATDSKCYDNSEANCTTYGRLYDWATAMGISSTYNSNSYNPSASTKYRGTCPTGWHIPSDAEWTTLTDYVGGSSTAGTKLKAASGWSMSGNGTDAYGFSALPGGFSNGFFHNVGSSGFWWSATEEYGYAWFWSMSFTSANAGKGYDNKTVLFSVRCVRD